MKKKLNILVACETSGTVRNAFAAKGHYAVSVDILPDDNGSADHYVEDIISFLGREGHKFDLMIAHPPCTYLCNSGVSWLFRDVDTRCIINRFVSGGVFYSRPANAARVQAMKKGAALFNALLHYAPIPHIAVENPVQHGWARTYICKQDQVIQPYMFGHPESKATCLWLKNLPKLQETNNVKKQWRALPPKQRNRLNWLPPSPQRWKLRSKTYDGIAQAMVDQWAPYVMQQI